jgi:predicted ATPase
LSDEASRELAECLLERRHAAGAPAEVVARTGEGNPLFIEELAASLAERSTSDTGDLPTSVRAIVSARLDALPAAERSALVDASVVGRVFWRGALAEIEPRDGLSAILGSLEERDLVRREAVSRIVGDQQFAFKHGLIHDVAYSTLPRAARRERHAAVARYLEATTSGAGQSHEALGHHFREAGDTERAVEHLVAAAEQAGRGWAKARALALYGEAHTLLPEADERRRRIRMQQAVLAQALLHLHEHDVRHAPPADANA